MLLPSQASCIAQYLTDTSCFWAVVNGDRFVRIFDSKLRKLLKLDCSLALVAANIRHKSKQSDYYNSTNEAESSDEEDPQVVSSDTKLCAVAWCPQSNKLFLSTGSRILIFASKFVDNSFVFTPLSILRFDNDICISTIVVCDSGSKIFLATATGSIAAFRLSPTNRIVRASATSNAESLEKSDTEKSDAEKAPVPVFIDSDDEEAIENERNLQIAQLPASKAARRWEQDSFWKIETHQAVTSLNVGGDGDLCVAIFASKQTVIYDTVNNQSEFVLPIEGGCTFAQFDRTSVATGQSQSTEKKLTLLTLSVGGVAHLWNLRFDRILSSNRLNLASTAIGIAADSEDLSNSSSRNFTAVSQSARSMIARAMAIQPQQQILYQQKQATVLLEKQRVEQAKREQELLEQQQRQKEAEKVDRNQPAQGSNYLQAAAAALALARSGAAQQAKSKVTSFTNNAATVTNNVTTVEPVENSDGTNAEHELNRSRTDAVLTNQWCIVAEFKCNAQTNHTLHSYVAVSWMQAGKFLTISDNGVLSVFDRRVLVDFRPKAVSIVGNVHCHLYSAQIGSEQLLYLFDNQNINHTFCVYSLVDALSTKLHTLSHLRELITQTLPHQTAPLSVALTSQNMLEFYQIDDRQLARGQHSDLKLLHHAVAPSDCLCTRMKWAPQQPYLFVARVRPGQTQLSVLKPSDLLTSWDLVSWTSTHLLSLDNDALVDLQVLSWPLAQKSDTEKSAEKSGISSRLGVLIVLVFQTSVSTFTYNFDNNELLECHSVLRSPLRITACAVAPAYQHHHQRVTTDQLDNCDLAFAFDLWFGCVDGSIRRVPYHFHTSSVSSDSIETLLQLNDNRCVYSMKVVREQLILTSCHIEHIDHTRQNLAIPLAELRIYSHLQLELRVPLAHSSIAIHDNGDSVNLVFAAVDKAQARKGDTTSNAKLLLLSPGDSIGSHTSLYNIVDLNAKHALSNDATFVSSISAISFTPNAHLLLAHQASINTLYQSDTAPKSTASLSKSSVSVHVVPAHLVFDAQKPIARPFYHPADIVQFLLQDRTARVKTIFAYLLQQISQHVDNISAETPLQIQPISLMALFEEPITSSSASAPDFEDDFYYKPRGAVTTSTTNSLTYGDGTPRIQADSFGSDQAQKLATHLQELALPLLTPHDQMHLLSVLSVFDEIFLQRNKTLDQQGVRFVLQLRSAQILRRRSLADSSAGKLSSRDLCFAFHSNTQEAFISLCAVEPLQWHNGLRETGVSIWLTNPSELRQLAERLAKAQYAKGKDPRHCMMLYLALNKKSMVQALMKVSQESECKKIWQFLSRDFEQEEHRTAALKNAYVLVGQKKYELAICFFLLAKKPDDACAICVQYLNDVELAVLLARLCCNDDAVSFPECLLQHATFNHDIYLQHMLLFRAQQRSGAIDVLLQRGLNNLAETPSVHLLLTSLSAQPATSRFCVDLLSASSLDHLRRRAAMALQRSGLNVCALDVAHEALKDQNAEMNDECKRGWQSIVLAASRSLMCARSTPAAHSSSALLRDIANQNATNAFFADLVAIGVYCSTEQIKLLDVLCSTKSAVLSLFELFEFARKFVASDIALQLAADLADGIYDDKSSVVHLPGSNSPSTSGLTSDGSEQIVGSGGATLTDWLSRLSTARNLQRAIESRRLSEQKPKTKVVKKYSYFDDDEPEVSSTTGAQSFDSANAALQALCHQLAASLFAEASMASSRRLQLLCDCFAQVGVADARKRLVMSLPPHLHAALLADFRDAFELHQAALYLLRQAPSESASSESDEFVWAELRQLTTSSELLLFIQLSMFLLTLSRGDHRAIYLYCTRVAPVSLLRSDVHDASSSSVPSSHTAQPVISAPPATVPKANPISFVRQVSGVLQPSVVQKAPAKSEEKTDSAEHGGFFAKVTSMFSQMAPTAVAASMRPVVNTQPAAPQLPPLSRLRSTSSGGLADLMIAGGNVQPHTQPIVKPTKVVVEEPSIPATAETWLVLHSLWRMIQSDSLEPEQNDQRPISDEERADRMFASLGIQTTSAKTLSKESRRTNTTTSETVPQSGDQWLGIAVSELFTILIVQQCVNKWRVSFHTLGLRHHNINNVLTAMFSAQHRLVSSVQDKMKQAIEACCEDVSNGLPIQHVLASLTPPLRSDSKSSSSGVVGSFSLPENISESEQLWQWSGAKSLCSSLANDFRRYISLRTQTRKSTLSLPVAQPNPVIPSHTSEDSDASVVFNTKASGGSGPRSYFDSVELLRANQNNLIPNSTISAISALCVSQTTQPFVVCALPNGALHSFDINASLAFRCRQTGSNSSVDWQLPRSLSDDTTSKPVDQSGYCELVFPEPLRRVEFATQTPQTLNTSSSPSLNYAIMDPSARLSLTAHPFLPLFVCVDAQTVRVFRFGSTACLLELHAELNVILQGVSNARWISLVDADQVQKSKQNGTKTPLQSGAYSSHHTTTYKAAEHVSSAASNSIDSLLIVCGRNGRVVMWSLSSLSLASNVPNSSSASAPALPLVVIRAHAHICYDMICIRDASIARSIQSSISTNPKVDSTHAQCSQPLLLVSVGDSGSGVANLTVWTALTNQNAAQLLFDIPLTRETPKDPHAVRVYATSVCLLPGTALSGCVLVGLSSGAVLIVDLMARKIMHSLPSSSHNSQSIMSCLILSSRCAERLDEVEFVAGTITGDIRVWQVRCSSSQTREAGEDGRRVVLTLQSTHVNVFTYTSNLKLDDKKKVDMLCDGHAMTALSMIESSGDLIGCGADGTVKLLKRI